MSDIENVSTEVEAEKEGSLIIAADTPDGTVSVVTFMANGTVAWNADAGNIINAIPADDPVRYLLVTLYNARQAQLDRAYQFTSFLNHMLGEDPAWTTQAFLSNGAASDSLRAALGYEGSEQPLSALTALDVFFGKGTIGVQWTGDGTDAENSTLRVDRFVVFQKESGPTEETPVQ